MTLGLNRNYNRELKDVFKGAATAATGRPGPLQDFYEGMIARGMRGELARVTLTRKLAALTLRLWKEGRKENATIQRSCRCKRANARTHEAAARGVPLADGSGLRDGGCGGQSQARRSPGRQVRRGTRLTIGPPADPEEGSGRPQRPSLR